MARPLRIEYPGAYYHVTPRGNEQKDIFKSQLGRKKFLYYLESSVVRYGAVITDFILGYFGGNTHEGAKQKYRKFVEGVLGKEYVSPLEATIASTILGSEKFVREVSKKHLGERKTERNVPAVKMLKMRLPLDEIIDIVKKELGEDGDLARKVSIFFCRKYSGAKLREIGEPFGISDAAVSQTSRRLELKAEEDRQLKKMINRIEVTLGDVIC